MFHADVEIGLGKRDRQLHVLRPRLEPTIRVFRNNPIARATCFLAIPSNPRFASSSETAT